MGRPKHDRYWNEVDKEKDGKLKCKKCGHKFKGGVSRIEAHIKGTGGIRKCSPPLNDTTSSNHSEQHMNVIDTSPVGERTEEMTDTVGSSINNGRVIQSSSLEAYCNEVVEGDQGTVEMVGGAANPENSPLLTLLLEGHEAENGHGVVTTLESNCDELISDLTSKEEDIQGQLQLMESRGKKRKGNVDEWLKELQNMKQRAIDVKKTLNNEMYLVEELQEQMYLVEELKKKIPHLNTEMPLVLSNEFVGKKFEENVERMWNLLREDEVFIIGIHGMGGVGKTFLATYMESEIKRTKTFKDVVWVTVSHDFTIFKLQQHIAEILKIKLYGDDERERALILASELEKRENIVLILDDVWKYIDMEKVGIPLRIKGNKLIITSRLRHVCQQMDCLPSNMIRVRPFNYGNDSDDDDDYVYDDDYVDDCDMELFLLKLGDHGTPSTLPSQVLDIARSMVGKCDGLPLGISVMARTMKGETRIHWWRHALNKLDKLEMGVEMQEEVLTVLRRSYDNLTEKDVQKCFLYGALLPNPVRDLLIMNHVDMVLLNGKRRLEEIFDEANVIVDKLRNHSLLLENNSKLMMHALVRKMALNIIKESGSNLMVRCDESMKKIPDIEEWTIDLEVVSLVNNVIQEIPDGTSPNCPRLSTLLLFDNEIRHIPECFFMHMHALTTLDLSRNDCLTRLPHSLSNLRTLTSLMLNGCSQLEYIPPLGDLQSLLRLDISGCFIHVPPEGLENLVNLKWLDMSSNVDLELVPGSFLPSLTNIQYLDLYGCSGIEVEDIEGMNFLECFAGAFVDRENLNRYVQQTLGSGYGPQTYSIYYQDRSHEGLWEKFWYRKPLSDEFKCRTMCIKDCEELSYVLPRDLVKLSVKDNGQWVCLCAALSSNGPSSLKKIIIQYCAKLKSLFCLSCSLCASMRSLQSLTLSHLQSLTTVFSMGMFFQLKYFFISECHGIKTLMTSSLASHLQNLESIIVSNCDSMEQIFAVTSDDNDSIKITLPKLITLSVQYLPQLKTVSERILVCKYGFRPYILDCPKLCKPRIEYLAL